jgi:hypothetical protein
MLLIFYFGFAQMGYLAFSVDVDEFRTFSMTLLTLFRSLVGDLDYDTLYDANRVVGPIFYITFYTLMLLILVNVFVAILGDAHQTIRQEDQEKEDEEAPDPLVVGMSSVFAAMSGKPVSSATFESALDSTMADGFCDLEELVSRHASCVLYEAPRPSGVRVSVGGGGIDPCVCVCVCAELIHVCGWVGVELIQTGSVTD